LEDRVVLTPDRFRIGRAWARPIRHNAEPQGRSTHAPPGGRLRTISSSRRSPTSPDEPRSALANSLLFRDLPADSLARLASLGRRRRYRRGEVLYHQEDPGDSLHVVESGHVKIVGAGESGTESVLTVLGPGDSFGELALIDGGPRSARVEALEAVRTISVSRSAFFQFLRDNPRAIEPLLVALAKTIRRLTETVTDLTALDLEGRLAKRLLQLADEYGEATDGGVEIMLPLTQEELAAMVGATRASVNKVLGWYEDAHAIQRRNRHIVVLDPHRLRARIT
jgi:CRP/FNR family cyclic AMP-dependent transcriptional regulator